MSSPHHISENEPENAHRGGWRFGWVAIVGVVTYALVRWWRRGRAEDENAGGVSREDIERGHIGSERMSHGGVTAFAAGLLVLVAGVLGAAALLMAILDGTPTRTDSELLPLSQREEYVSREAPLQADPSVDLLRVRRREYRQLSGYGWVDSSQGIVSIPIERAMEMLAQADDTVSASDGEHTRLRTESGFVSIRPGVPPPGAPPYLGGGQEPYAVSPEYARELGLIDANSEQE